jgi:hypothetical protein
MNIETESPPSSPPVKPDTFDLPASPDPEERAVLSSNIAKLQDDLDQERDERKEERFHWICVAAFLLDIVAYGALDSFWPFLVLFMFQLIVLVGIARRLGVDWAVHGFGWLLFWISQKLALPKPDGD